jgi:hypothetical protein
VAITTEIDIVRKRGDTFPIQFTITKSGVAYNITSHTLVLTVNSEPEPTSTATQLFNVAGTITNGATGAFEFRPTAGNMGQVPEVYYYDVQMTDTSGYILTIAKGRFTIEQDITK